MPTVEAALARLSQRLPLMSWVDTAGSSSHQRVLSNLRALPTSRKGRTNRQTARRTDVTLAAHRLHRRASRVRSKHRAPPQRIRSPVPRRASASRRALALTPLQRVLLATLRSIAHRASRIAHRASPTRTARPPTAQPRAASAPHLRSTAVRNSSTPRRIRPAFVRLQ